MISSLISIYFNSLQIESTQRCNLTIYKLRKIPFIKNIIRESLYGKYNAKGILFFIELVTGVIRELIYKTLIYMSILVWPIFLFSKGITFGIMERNFFTVEYIIISLITFFVFSTMYPSGDEKTYAAFNYFYIEPKGYLLVKFIKNKIKYFIYNIVVLWILSLFFNFIDINNIILTSVALVFIGLVMESSFLKITSKMRSFKDSISINVSIVLCGLLYFIYLASFLTVRKLGSFRGEYLSFLEKVVGLFTNPFFIGIALVLGILGSMYIFTYKKYDQFRVLELEAHAYFTKVVQDSNKDEVEPDKDCENKVKNYVEEMDYIKVNKLFYKRHIKIFRKKIRNDMIFLTLFSAISIFCILFLISSKYSDLRTIYSFSLLWIMVGYFNFSDSKYVDMLFSNMDLTLALFNGYNKGEKALSGYFYRIGEMLKIKLPAYIYLNLLVFAVGYILKISLFKIFLALIVLSLIYVFLAVEKISCYYLFRLKEYISQKKPFFVEKAYYIGVYAVVYLLAKSFLYVDLTFIVVLGLFLLAVSAILISCVRNKIKK